MTRSAPSSARTFLAAALATLAAGGAVAASAPAPDLAVRVDPRVELVSIACRLAGFPEYAQPNARSPYSDAVDAWFGGFADHPVVGALQRLRAERGISYDAPMDLAVHLTAPPELAERVDLDSAPARLDGRWTAADAREVAGLLRRFAADARHAEFVAGQRGFHERAEARMRAALADRVETDWLDRFFGARPGARFVVIPGLLNGGASYGCGVELADGAQEILPVVGASAWDADGLPVFGDDFVPTVVHELVHSYANPLVDAWAARLQAAAERLLSHCRPTMELQAYGTWRAVMYESLVRACVVRHAADTSGEDAALALVRVEEGRNGFAWTGALADLLAEYERSRDRVPDLAAFMPEVAAFFDGYSVEYDRRLRLAPRVVSISPPDGARDVDPGIAELVVTFDRPMQPGSWSVVGGGPAFPELQGQPSYDATGTVLRVGLRLQPGREYRFGLNSLDHVGFRSRDGIALQPVRVGFATRTE